jgi:ribonuclease HII
MTLRIRHTADSFVEIGIDEAGRGSFWGPIVAGAVLLPLESSWTDAQKSLFAQFRDSKKLSAKKRNALAKTMKEQLQQYGVGIVTADEINREGITWANREAFRRAIHAIPQLPPVEECRILIDGVLALDRWMGQMETIVEGDNQYMAIAAASILAKVAHDEWIHSYCDAHPECNERYDLTKSNGYGTAKHREGIQLYGGHELHRVQYIQRWLPGSTVPKKEKKQKGKPNECLIRFT